jgi:hypothetical protein
VLVGYTVQRVRLETNSITLLLSNNLDNAEEDELTKPVRVRARMCLYARARACLCVRTCACTLAPSRARLRDDTNHIWSRRICNDAPLLRRRLQGHGRE